MLHCLDDYFINIQLFILLFFHILTHMNYLFIVLFIIKNNIFHNIRWQHIFPYRPEVAAMFGIESLSVN